MVKAKLRSILSLLLAMVLITGLAEPALAAETATSMKLGKSEGTVTVYNASDRKLSAREGMKLSSGYTIETAAASYVLINLDDAKLVKLDASSKVEIRKSGKHLEILLKYGSVYVDVSEHLKDDETLEIPTSTATVGIRGTKVTVKSLTALEETSGTSRAANSDAIKSPAPAAEAVPGNSTELIVIEGTASMTVPSADPAASGALAEGSTDNNGSSSESSHTIYVSAGQSAVASPENPGEHHMSQIGAADIPGFAQRELTKDGDYTFKTAEGSETITQADAQQKLINDQAEAARRTVENASRGSEKPTTKQTANPTWNTGKETAPTPASQDSDDSRDESPSVSKPTAPVDPPPADPSPVKPSPVEPEPEPEPSEYTVTFDSQGGSAVTRQTVAENEKASAPTAPTRTGYTFQGWYTDSAGTAAYDFDTPVTADLTLYAMWKVQAYTITFDSQGGSAVDSQTVIFGETALSPAAPTRTDYIFQGWYTDSAGTAAYDFDSPVTANLTLYAKWKGQAYTVAFDSQGGSAVDSQTVESGKTASSPAAPTRTGYTFQGWCTDSAGTAAYDFDSPVTANLTLYAMWNIQEYTVTFDSQGGSAVDSQTVEFGETASSPAAPTRTDYEFQGWYTDSAGTAEHDFDSPVTADLTLYAKWARVYTLTQSGSNIYMSVADGIGVNNDLDAVESLLEMEDYVIVRSNGGNNDLLVEDTFTVPAGKTLRMEAGLSVGLYGGYTDDNTNRPGTLAVEGTLDITGTGSISISITNDVAGMAASEVRIGANGSMSISSTGGLEMKGNMTNNGTLVIAASGCDLQFSGSSTFTNAGTIENSGTITLVDCAMTNTGTIQNNGAILVQNSSTFNGSGDVTGNPVS